MVAVPLVGAGLALGALAFALFTVMDTTIKWLSAGYPVHELLLLFSNALFALVPVAVVTLRRGGIARLRTRRLHMHVLRGLLGMCGGFLAFYAYRELPLADAYAMIFTTPLLITALSVPILGEHVGWRRWSAVAVGFVGVLIMLRPGIAPIGIGSLSALGAACFSACAILLGAQAQRDREQRQHRPLQQPHRGPGPWPRCCRSTASCRTPATA